MSYITKQRNEIYKKALKAYTEEECIRNARGLCWALYHVSKIQYADQERYLDEFAFFNPSGVKWSWFGHDKDGFLARQIILDFCILMTETK